MFVDTFNLNGHVVSFEAGLGRADIKDIMEKRFVHPEARDALEPGIRSDSLLASSLFCLFQNYQITSSFRVLDSTGNFIDGNKERAIRDFFMRRFAPKGSTAAGLDAQPGDKLPVAETNKGLPSPQNPFVLGYSITQLVPQPTKGIPVFNPINFQFSVTGSERRGFPTLNYLMLTETIPDRANVKKHADAGSFEKTFFDIIHADYVDSERGTPVFDAAIGISRRSFVDQYIVRQVLEAYAPQLPQFPGFNVTSKSNDTDFFGEENGKFRTKKTQKWESNKVKIQSSHWTEDTLGAWHYETWSGTLETSVSYHSDDTYALPVDGQRRLYIDVEGKVKTKLYVTNDILNTSFLNLDKCYDINYEFTYSQALIVSTSSNATWSVSKGAGSWPATEFKDGKTRLVMTNKRGGRGIFVKADGLGLMAVINWFDAFDRLGANNAICERTTAISSIDYTRLQESINKGLKGLTGALIMPAGNVLSYNGLSTDSQGNVFSLVNYKTVVGGSRSATSFK